MIQNADRLDAVLRIDDRLWQRQCVRENVDAVKSTKHIKPVLE